MFEERGAFRVKIIRTGNLGIAPTVATAYPAAFQHCDIGNAVLFCQVISCGKAMSSPADNDHVIGFLRFRRTPGRLPVLVAPEGMVEDFGE